MGYQDRQYYRDGGGQGGLGGALGVLGFSAPFGTWFGVRVRLHFWMLLSMLFIVIGYARAGSAMMMALHLALFIAAVMLHEFGHRLAAQLVGGSHNEFMLWPAGGTIPPQVPERPGTMFVAHAGGIVMNLLLVGLCYGGLVLMGLVPAVGLDRILGALGGGGAPWGVHGGSLLATLLSLFLMLNIGVALAAVLPYYWFDGAPLLESVLWKWITRKQAINVTCIVGMVLAVPMLLLSVWAANFFGMIFWGLLFYTAYARRRQLAFEFSNDFDAEIASSASYRAPPVSRRRPGAMARWMAQRKVAKEQQEQAAVDRILEKVAQHGMHSLNNSEKRTLARASERLRNERRM